MVTTISKPILSISDQIEHLNQKGVKFERMSKEAAEKYLTDNNNYFKLTAYRKNFTKHPDGESAGKYIDLDFAQLRDLAIIDMRLRYTLLQMALDVEHYSKVKLIKQIQTKKQDGYSIVYEYISSLSDKDKGIYQTEINKNIKNPYCGSIYSKYHPNYPVWAFVEVIPFGRFVDFYQFCAGCFEDKRLKDDYFLLLSSKVLRNAAAHSNCILNDLALYTTQYKTNFNVSRELMKIDGMTKEIREKRTSNTRIQQITTLLYAHKSIVTSGGMHQHTSQMLQELMKRIFYHIDYYKSNDLILSTFKFLKIVVDNWFNLPYNDNT